MSKRKSTNSVLSFDDVLNDINDWLAEGNGENDEIDGNLDELCGGQEEIDSNPREECLEEEKQSEEPEDNVRGTRIHVYRGEFHPWVEFALVSGQTYLTVYMLNRGEISPLPLPFFKTGRNLPRG